MYKYKEIILFFVFFSIFHVSEGFGEVKCVDSEGEAYILNNDSPSAKAEAIARAKWSAVEEAVGVRIKAQTIIQNMALIDEAMSKQIRGIVKEFRVLHEESRDDIFRVKLNVCVEPIEAHEVVSSLALNNSIAVFIPAKKPEAVKDAPFYNSKREEPVLSTEDVYEETSILSETLINRLTEQGYTVIDIATAQTIDSEDIEEAMRLGNHLALRNMMCKFLSNILLIGKVDYTISTEKGQDIGYGIAMPFNNVTVRLTYRIVTRDNAGNVVILSAGAEEGYGLAMSLEDAFANGLNDLAKKTTAPVLYSISRHIKDIDRKVHVNVSGVVDVKTNFEIKEALQSIVWVTNVEERGQGEFIVSYPENAIYLANSIEQKKSFRVVTFSPYLINISYER